MSNNYLSNVKSGKLKLKGNKSLFKSDKSKTKKTASTKVEVDEDQLERGGWRRISNESDIKGGIDIIIECGDFSCSYLSAQDNGKFILGAKHFIYGEPPNAEEILSLIKSPDDQKISLKTGFGKYVGVDAEGHLVAVADAIGSRERFEIISQDGKYAILSASNGLFLNLSSSTPNVLVSSKTVTANEIVNIRTNVGKQEQPNFLSSDDLKEAGDCEKTYVKMYQHSKVDMKNKKITFDASNKLDIQKAQKNGTLHEALLNRRSKSKSDKYC